MEHAERAELECAYDGLVNEVTSCFRSIVVFSALVSLEVYAIALAFAFMPWWAAGLLTSVVGVPLLVATFGVLSITFATAVLCGVKAHGVYQALHLEGDEE